MVHRGAAAHHELPIVRIDDRYRPRAVLQYVDVTPLHAEAPRLRVVRRRREHREAERKEKALFLAGIAWICGDVGQRIARPVHCLMHSAERWQ